MWRIINSERVSGASLADRKQKKSAPIKRIFKKALENLSEFKDGIKLRTKKDFMANLHNDETMTKFVSFLGNQANFYFFSVWTYYYMKEGVFLINF